MMSSLIFHAFIGPYEKMKEAVLGPIVCAPGMGKTNVLARLIYHDKTNEKAVIKSVYDDLVTTCDFEDLDFDFSLFYKLRKMMYKNTIVVGRKYTYDSEVIVFGRIVEIAEGGVMLQPIDKTKTPVHCVLEIAEVADYPYLKDRCFFNGYDIHELVWIVCTRIHDGIPYTYLTKNITIFVNSIPKIEELYTRETMELYRNKGLGLEPAHVFAVADKAYRHMRTSKVSQSIIFSGNPGSGRSGAMTDVLKYLFHVSNPSESESSVQGLILDGMFILECFGNRCTSETNVNSSMFTQFFELQFNDDGKIIGGYVNHYLFNKGNLNYLSTSMRNPHIFYMLLAGLPDPLKTDYELTNPDNFCFISHGCTRYFTTDASEKYLRENEPDRLSKAHREKGGLKHSKMDDRENFYKLKQALLRIGLSDDEIVQIYKFLAGILHIGNIKTIIEADGACNVSKTGAKSLAIAAKLLGMEESDLANIVTRAALLGVKDSPATPKYRFDNTAMTSQEAHLFVNSVFRNLYRRLFDYIVWRINGCISSNVASYTIGLLDVCRPITDSYHGHFFHDLCMFYLNEKLEIFISLYIDESANSLYRDEGVSLKVPSYPHIFSDHGDFIDVFENEDKGLFVLLDRETNYDLNRKQGENFAFEVHDKWEDSYFVLPPSISPKKKEQERKITEGFLLQHRWSTIFYETDLFAQSNLVHEHPEIERLFLKSNDSLMQDLFQYDCSYKTITSCLRQIIDDIINKLRETEVHVVRCIKANNGNKPDFIKESYIVDQFEKTFRCGISIKYQDLKCGHYVHFRFSDLHDMAKKSFPSELEGIDSKTFCSWLASTSKLNLDDYCVGRSRIFFKPDKFSKVIATLSDPTTSSKIRKRFGPRLDEEGVSSKLKNVVKKLTSLKIAPVILLAEKI